MVVLADPLGVLTGGPRRPGHLRRVGRGPVEGRVIRVRPAMPNDTTACGSLFAEAYADGDGFLTGPTEPRSFTLPPAIPDGPTALVAEIDGSVQGVVLIQGSALARLRHCRTIELVVARTARGGGVGGALLDAALDSLRSRTGVQFVRLAVFVDNIPALTLYHSRGFIEEGRRIGFACEADGRLRDDLLMVRTLP